MQFTTFSFAVFFPIVVLCFYIMPKRARQLWLLVASYYFYMGWSAQYALLIFASTVTTFGCGLLLERCKEDSQGKKKLVLVSSLLINLGILVFFKYFYFLHDTVDTILSYFGMGIGESRLQIILPVGISFYTFQAIGYTIDVYRGDVKAERNFIRYALFVSFFPQLVAGPIERSGHLLSQIQEITDKNKRQWDFEKVTSGLLLMLWGYFLKMVIADRAAIFVDSVFDYYYMAQGASLLVAAILFSVQLYCDFASYSTIAIGAARVLGIELIPNFAAPFLSRSIGEFWRRWHISLSQWLRDYVYIPLGGSRCSKIRKYRNTLITFFVSGLWHGASWHYVLWGTLQGVFIVIGDILRPVKQSVAKKCNMRTETFGIKAVQTICTFALFTFSLVLFRAETVRDGLYYLQRMVTHFDIWSFFDEALLNLGLDRKEIHVLLFGIVLMVIVDFYYQFKKAYFDQMVKSQCLAVQYIVTIALFLMILVFGIYGEAYDATQFIYFQF